VRGDRHLPNKSKQNISIFYPIYSSNYDMRETGYMGIIQQNIVRVRFLLDWRNCSVGSVGSVDAVDAVGKPINPIHGGIDSGWGAPCPQSRD